MFLGDKEMKFKGDLNINYKHKFRFIRMFYYIKQIIIKWFIQMDNQITNEGIELIKAYEGFRSNAYRDIVGVWTIGYGHTKGVKSGDKMTEPEAFELFITELADYGYRMSLLIKVPINDNQYSALVSFVYNLGVGALQFSTLLKRLNKGDYTLDYDGNVIIERKNKYKQYAIKSEFERWNKAGGEPVYGLLRRRKAEYKLFRS